LIRQAKFLRCQSETAPDHAFLLEYQRAVLLTLLQEGLVTQEQFDACVCQLEGRKMSSHSCKAKKSRLS
jgi:hypothetical protein